MTTSVVVAADLDSFALILSVGPEDSDDMVRAAVDASAVQRPSAVVVNLMGGGRRSKALLWHLSRMCAEHAVPLLVAPLLMATIAVTATSALAVRSYATVEGALASLPHATTPSAYQRSMRLPPAETTPAEARAVARAAARSWGLDHLVFPTELVTSEFVSNAVMHAGTTVDLLIRRIDEGVYIGVRDQSPAPPVPTNRAPSDVTSMDGRGLYLVSTAASRWGYLVGTVNKVVWAVVDK